MDSSLPENALLHEIIDARTAADASRIAAVCHDRSLSYSELHARSNQLAHYLIDSGIGRGDLVGICVKRSIELPIVLLGVLKTGAGYVPLDPEYPGERLAFMCQDACLRAILSEDALAERNDFGQCPIIPIDRNAARIALCSADAPSPAGPESSRLDDVAYVIYTSGSTGRPKGVRISHRSIINLLKSFADQPGFTQDDCFLALTTLSFDISVAEIFVPLITGGRIAIIDKETATDGRLLKHAIDQHDVTVMQATPPTWRFLLESGWTGKTGLTAISTGEAMPRDLVAPLLNRAAEVWNLYGPTETTVWSTRWRVPANWASLPRDQQRVLIGTAIDNTTLSIVDASMNPVANGEEGELLIGGDGVALGYLNRDELTRERFIVWNDQRFYRTGDLARVREAGEFECLGRIDSQVKVNGFRIELEEIEAVLAEHSSVRRAAVVVYQRKTEDAQLLAHVIPTSESCRASDLIEHARRRLPEYMVPLRIIFCDTFPLTPSGKLDRNGFPAPARQCRESSIDYVAPVDDKQRNLADLWADVLDLDRVGITDNFFHFGGNSIRANRLIANMRDRLDIQISVAELFDRPTIAQLTQSQTDSDKQPALPVGKGLKGASRHLNSDDSRFAGRSMHPSSGYAIIGMAARFPGSDNLLQFWNNLVQGVESIRRFSAEELDRSLPTEHTTDPSYVAARGVIDDADCFDAEFFQISPREADLIDPQQRVLLELAYHAIEDAGISPTRPAGAIGVWAGTYSTSYLTENLLPDADVVESVGRFQLGVYNEKDYLAARIANRLNLRGPAVNVNTACSTSLVAVIEACKSLAAGHCDAALAGGVSIQFPQASGHLYQTGSILSPDGHCRPFDEQAAGTVFSDGAGLVVLKRLEDACRDGDRIYAVIRGLGINNDGGDKASFTAPSGQGQAEAIQMALRESGFDSTSIGYIETHGTATPMGDPIEIEGISRALGELETSTKTWLGSVKGNIGHCVAAAGVAGLIKTALALHHQTIPSTMHFKNLNPLIDLHQSRFEVADRNIPWLSDRPRRAGVSSFGVGGTNAHLLLEEAPREEVRDALDSEACAAHLLPLSASDPSALDRMASDMASVADRYPIADIAFTLQTGRREWNHRRCVIVEAPVDPPLSSAGREGRDGASLKSTRRMSDLAFGQTDNSLTGVAPSRPKEVVWMFPGQGSQSVDMGRGLYQQCDAYRAAFDEVCDLFRPLIGCDLRELIFSGEEDDSDAIDAKGQRLAETQWTQPATFAVSYALSQTLLDMGLRPSALIGHSIGEFVAATIAGVFELPDACRLIAARGQLMQQLPEGSMLSVRADADTLRAHFGGGEVDIAAFNGPESCVASGPTAQIDQLAERLESAGIVSRKLLTSHAFHSSMMDSIVEPFAELVASVECKPPAIPIVSTVSGTTLTNEQATDARYWSEHLRRSVRFTQAVQTIWEADPTRILLEVGPRDVLTMLSRQSMSDPQTQTAIATLGRSSKWNTNYRCLLQAVGQLWVNGQDVRWEALHNEPRSIVSLKGYPFARDRHFIDPPSRDHQRSTKPIEPTKLTTSAKPTVRDPYEQTERSMFDIEEERNSDNYGSQSRTQVQSMNQTNRKPLIAEEVADIFEKTSGIDIGAYGSDATFFEMGMDSLILTQTAAAIKRTFGVDVSFRQLLEEVTSASLLVDLLDHRLPTDRYAAQTSSVHTASDSVADGMLAETVASTDSHPLDRPSIMHREIGRDDIRDIVNQQLEIMRNQLAVLGGTAGQNAQQRQSADTYQSVVVKPSPDENRSTETTSSTTSTKLTLQCRDDQPSAAKKVFGAGARVSLDATGLDAHQQRSLDNFVSRYNSRTDASKTYAQTHRARLADPRTVSGFRPDLKQMTYPIVVDRSKGALLWDIDGNEYVDFTCGFGSNFLGHTPEMIVDAIADQAARGYEIGPQHPLAGQVARLFCELTGAERMAFCNTGSEAVLGCCRLARTVTGRDKIVMFHGDYHGILDEVVVRGNDRQRSFPAAAGIPASMVENVVLLEYGAAQSLAYIREHLDELAAVLVEPVQSRRPEHQPVAFLRELGKLLSDQPTALIFDEVICGFRIAPGGAQEYFGVQADLAAYGKIVGGGMPIGVIAGRAEFMDALDGGFWRFDDDSRPEVGMTYFAGTFVRHPLALAASHATLTFIKSQGRGIYDRINDLSSQLADRLNRMFEHKSVPIQMAHFGSLFKTQFTIEQPFSEVFFAMLRQRGVFAWDHRPCLITLEHSQQHIDFIFDAFSETVDEMLRGRLLLLAGTETTHSDHRMGVTSLSSMGSKTGSTEPTKDTLPGNANGSVATASEGLAKTQPQVNDVASTAKPIRPRGPIELSVPIDAEDFVETRFTPTEAQSEVWLACTLSPQASCAYNECATLKFDGELDADRLLEALRAVCRRHPMLRSTFSADGQHVHVHHNLLPIVHQYDLSRLPPDEQTELFEAFIHQEGLLPFDLCDGPLIRATLHRRGPTSHELTLTAHHLVLDGWSLNVICRDLGHLYDGECLPESQSFVEYAAAMRDYHASESASHDREFWTGKFSDGVPILDLPVDRASDASIVRIKTLRCNGSRGAGASSAELGREVWLQSVSYDADKPGGVCRTLGWAR
ncbi:MAG: amino acid adenylation domain-containing protein [Pirellulaceae bacterium]